MTLEECYARMNGDYAEAKSRLMSDSLVEKFLLRFPDDPSTAEFRGAVEAGDVKGSFAAAHALKGVAGNLALTRLFNAASALSEQLRPMSEAADEALVREVFEAYDETIAAIEAYRS